jgi:hypothetical protein
MGEERSELKPFAAKGLRRSRQFCKSLSSGFELDNSHYDEFQAIFS